MTTLTHRISELEAHVNRLAGLAVDAYVAGQNHAVEELEQRFGAAMRDLDSLKAEGARDVDWCSRCNHSDVDGLGLDREGVCFYCRVDEAGA